MRNLLPSRPNRRTSGVLRRPAARARQAPPDSSSQSSKAAAELLQAALKFMDEVHNRDLTRIVCVYELVYDMSGHAMKTPDENELVALYEFGQFKSHIEKAKPLLPAPIVISECVKVGLSHVTLELTEVTACLLVTPRGDLALVLDGSVPRDVGVQQVAKLLDTTCADRREMSVDGTACLDWLRVKARDAGLELPADLKFGQNVHQCVFPGGALLDGVRAGDSFWRIINRVAAPFEPNFQGVSFKPPELNYPGITVVGHGRGVSVIAGYAEAVENSYVLIAIMLVTALSVLHRSREKLFAAMNKANAAPAPAASIASAKRARDTVVSLAGELNQLQLDLEFGVESYLDSVVIPDLIIEAFQRSLCNALGLGAALDHSSRMLDRLASVIQAQRLALDTAFQKQSERRDKVFASTLAIVTLLAVPPALLLAFFALPGNVQNSLRNVGSHGAAYGAVWGIFIIVIVTAWIARSLIRTRPPS